MKVTFMVGNGFDLCLGLKTRYVDMYESYIEEKNTLQVIEDFKQLLREDAPTGYKTWGDFEMAMGRHAGFFKSERDFVLCTRHFKNHMATHLLNEQNHFLEPLGNVNICEAIAQEMEHSLGRFYEGLIPNDVHTLEELDNGLFQYLGTITFNYTTTFDWAFACLDKRNDPSFSGAPIIHVHGSLDSDVVLGVDNPSQIIGASYQISRLVSRAFIKPHFNSEFDSKRVKEAQQLILNSNVLCVYGLSLGESDQVWIDFIRSWLESDTSHHLVFYRYSERVYSPWMRDASMDEEDAEKEKLHAKICRKAINSEELQKSLYPQVHIPIGKDIFAIKALLFKARLGKIVTRKGAFTENPPSRIG